jgi:large subunit ribosomal protein L4
MTLSIDIRKSDGTKAAGSVTLDEYTFGIQPHVPVMHQVVVAQLAARRAGTQATKTRAEVSGGGKKPWAQKGTGRARQGSTRAPHWVGGGVALGPQPRDYAQRTPKKMINLALRSALSDRYNDNRVIVIEDMAWSTPKTKDAVAFLNKFDISDQRVLLVLDGDDEATILSFRNLPNVHIIGTQELNAYDVLASDYIVFTTDTVPSFGGQSKGGK